MPNRTNVQTANVFPFFSVIIPVYNRPHEVEELLQSLCNQNERDFEVLIIEDGSTIDCKSVVSKYKERLKLYYHNKTNTGPGSTRNYGAERAVGNYLVFFDSDCIIPPLYFDHVKQFILLHNPDAYGGPDMAHPSFTPVQKSINYAMTSFFTTGGIRGGGNKQLEKFHPRSFNMGIKRAVFLQTLGFSSMRFGEDIDLSIRLHESGFKTVLIKQASVYHKRRSTFTQFYKQIHNSGIARINLFLRHPKSLKLVHLLPASFLVGSLGILLLSLWNIIFLIPLIFYILLLFFDALIKNNNILVATLSIVASLIQLSGYGAGFIKATFRRLILKQDEFQAFEHTFYK